MWSISRRTVYCNCTFCTWQRPLWSKHCTIAIYCAMWNARHHHWQLINDKTVIRNQLEWVENLVDIRPECSGLLQCEESPLEDDQSILIKTSARFLTHSRWCPRFYFVINSTVSLDVPPLEVVGVVKQFNCKTINSNEQWDWWTRSLSRQYTSRS